MKQKYLLSSKSHEDWRNYLIVNSFFFDVLMRYLRVKLKLPKKGLYNSQKIDEWEDKKFFEIRRRLIPKSKGNKSNKTITKEVSYIKAVMYQEVYKEIWETLEKFSHLNLSFSLLRLFALGHKNTLIVGSLKVFMVSSPKNPILETGIYIKYTPELNEKEMVELMRQAKNRYQMLFNITHNSKLKIRQKKAQQPTKQQLIMYQTIENYLRKNYSSHPDAIKMQTVFDGVADKLKVNRDSLQRSYHAILRNFQLPTSVNTKQIVNLTTS